MREDTEGGPGGRKARKPHQQREKDTSSEQLSKQASAILAVDIGTATCTAEWVVEIGDFRSKPVQLTFETRHGGQKDRTEIPTQIAVLVDQNKHLFWRFVYETVGARDKAVIGDLKRGFADFEQLSSGEGDDSAALAGDDAARDCDATALGRTYIPRLSDCEEAWNDFTKLGVDERTLREEITPPNALAKFLSCIVLLFKEQVLDSPLADEEYRKQASELTIGNVALSIRVAVPSHYPGTTTARFVELAQSAGIEKVEVDLEIAALCTPLSKELEIKLSEKHIIIIDGGGGSTVRPRTGDPSTH